VTVVLLPIIVLVLLPVIVNVATQRLPESWDRYLWLAWPAAAMLTGFVILAEAARTRLDRSEPPIEPAQLHRAARELSDAVARQWRAEAAVLLGRWRCRPAGT